MKNLLFYYSGTGNSLYDAITIGKGLRNATLISMRHKENQGYTVSGCSTAGFVFPVHYWGIPGKVKQFIKELKIENVSYAYVVVTYSSWEVNTLYEISKLLEEKGCPVDYVTLHKNVNSHITSIVANAYTISQNIKADNELMKITEDIKMQKINRIPKYNSWKQFAKKAAVRWLNQNETARQDFYVSNACRHCGICKDICGGKNIQLGEKGPEFGEECDECLSCMQYCPYQAIYSYRIKEERKRYHHPFVSSSRIGKSQIMIENGSMQESTL